MNLGLGIVLCTYYLLIGLGLNLAYHRILAHRSLRLPKNIERFLVTLGLPAGTPIQWVGTHRFHHRHADTELDPHSPVQKGFLYAHAGWYLGSTNPIACILYCIAGPFRILIDAFLRPRTNQQYASLAKDISSDVYYLFVSRPRIYAMLMIAHFIIPTTLVLWISGLAGFLCFWLFLIYAYNAAESVDSLAHLWGEKGDASSNARDVPIFGILSMGEGWHASHHKFPYSARHGLQKWQFDAVWQIIKFLRFLGIATDVRLPGSEDEAKTDAQILRVKSMRTDVDFDAIEHDPGDPNPWLALYLDHSLPLGRTVKAALLDNGSSSSRQFLLPVVRPIAKLTIASIQVLKIFIPNKFTSSKVLHTLIYYGLRTFARPKANLLILRHFHIGSELLEFIAKNTPGINITLNPLKPRCLEDLRDDFFLKHDLNIYNFIIRFNKELEQKKLVLKKGENLDFSMITDGDFGLAEMPDKWSNFLDLETAIETYTPTYQLFLTDSDFWRACNSLQLDETIALYASRLFGDTGYMGLVNNKHPLIPLTTFQAGYRLLLHGLAAESLHATLVEHKRRGQLVSQSFPSAPSSAP